MAMGCSIYALSVGGEGIEAATAPANPLGPAATGANTIQGLTDEAKRSQGEIARLRLQVRR